MAEHWAIDVGTTNTLVARWDEEAGGPVCLSLEGLVRPPINHADPRLNSPAVIPSAVYLRPRTWWERLLRRGAEAWIGQPALERREGHADRLPKPFASSFKPLLGLQSHQIVAYAGARGCSVRQVMRIFLSELLTAARRQARGRVTDLALTVPVDCYEPYRAELQEIGRRLGVRRCTMVDEPIAAAIGYGLNVERERHVLVVDFGGGTLDLAVVRTGEQPASPVHHAEVVAKSGRSLGGDTVDRWLVEEYGRRAGVDLTSRPDDYWQDFWRRLVTADAQRVKEALFFDEEATFLIKPPPEFRRGAGDAGLVRLRRDEFIDLLTRQGLPATLEEALAEVLAEAAGRGVEEKQIAEVLMVGGSTLLPGVYRLFEDRFGRDRVRDWQPFEAVAYGACAFAAGNLVEGDFIRHDYALKIYNQKERRHEYPIIVPQGTRYPTRLDLWREDLKPVSPRGQPVREYRLVICELGARHDERGRLQAGSGAIVELNDTNPVLGELRPPHDPRDRASRLRVAFGVNEDRWLCATVDDLQRSLRLKDQEPIVRLR